MVCEGGNEVIKKVEKRIATVNSDTVDVIDIHFVSGKRLKLLFDENEEHYFYDEADGDRL